MHENPLKKEARPLPLQLEIIINSELIKQNYCTMKKSLFSFFTVTLLFA